MIDTTGIRSRPLARRQGGRKAGPRCYRPRLEALEERTLLATDTWTGGGGPNGGWSDPANWSNGVPNAGDDLVFGNFSSPNTVVVNDLPPGMTFNALTFYPFAGYPPFPPVYGLGEVDGNPIALTGGLMGGSTVVNLAGISLAADQTFSGSPEIRCPIEQNGFTLTCVGVPLFSVPFNANGSVVGSAQFSGPITLTAPCSFVGSSFVGSGFLIDSINLNGYNLTLDGSASQNNTVTAGGVGSIIKNGSGTWDLRVNPDNYSGPTTVNAGLLHTFGTLPGQVSVYGGQLLSQGTVVGPVNVFGGTLNENLGGTLAGSPLGPVLTTVYYQLLSDHDESSDLKAFRW